MPVLDNARHERFAQELAKGKTQTEAYLIAGYTGDRTAASRLSTNANIQQRVDELKAVVAERVIVDEAYVLGTIKDTVERCRQSSPVLDRKGEPVFIETPEGNITPAYTFDAGNVLRGSEMLGKYLGMFVEKHEHTGKDGGPLEIVSDHDLAKLIAYQLFTAAEETAH